MKAVDIQMLNLGQALEKILSHVNVLDVEEKLLFQCIGQVAAEDIFSEYNVPMAATGVPDGGCHYHYRRSIHGGL